MSKPWAGARRGDLRRRCRPGRAPKGAGGEPFALGATDPTFIPVAGRLRYPVGGPRGQPFPTARAARRPNGKTFPAPSPDWSFSAFFYVVTLAHVERTLAVKFL